MIMYQDTKVFSAEELKNLFNAVGWLSGRFPEELVAAMRNSSAVISAWSGDELVGLINVLDDKALTAYIHYVLVSPNFQNQGIGRTLVEKVKKMYENYLYLLLVAEDPKNISYYEKFGFTVPASATPMLIYGRDTQKQ